MYKITCDEYVLHDVRIEELKVIGATCNLEVNKTGSLTFDIHPTHPYYNVIHKHTSEITLYRDDRELFVGRVLNDEIDFNNIKHIECEGELSYFIDSIQRGKIYQLDGGSENVIETYLKDIVDIHNQQVDERKRFSVGVVNVTDPNNYLYKISNYENTLSVLNDDLLGTYAGYFQIRRSEGVRYIDYLHQFTNSCNQRIEFGKNIIDLKQFIKGEDIYTAIIPLGATLDSLEQSEPSEQSETEESYDKRINISSIPDQTEGSIVKFSDYIYDSEAVKKWGWIWKVEKWDDVTVDTNLFTKGKNALLSSINENLSIEMTALDLNLVDINIDSVMIGDLIECYSLPHNLHEVFVVKSMTINVDNPQNTSIKLELPSRKTSVDTSLSSSTIKNDKVINNVTNTINESYTTVDDMNKNNESLKDWVDDGYISLGADEDIKSVDDLKDWVNDNFLPQGADGAVDLTGYARIVDVNIAFNELATALEEV